MITSTKTVDTGHEDLIHDAQLDFYGTFLATCSSDRTIKVFDVSDGQQLLTAELKGHNGPVWQIAWSHPSYGSLLASCSFDRRVIIWKEVGSSWMQLYEYENHDSSVNSVCWAPYQVGLVLACGSSDGCISILSNKPETNVWEAQKIKDAHAISVNCVHWSPAMYRMAENQEVICEKRIVSGGSDGLVKVWKEVDKEWKEEASLCGHDDWVRDVAWAPFASVNKQRLASCGQDKRVIIWQKEMRGDSKWVKKQVISFDDIIWSVSWCLTGSVLAVSGRDNRVSLWKEKLNGQFIELTEGATTSSPSAITAS